MTLDGKINVPDDVTRSALAFVQRLLGPIAEASDFISDKVRFYRFRSAVRTVELADQIVQRSGQHIRQVPLKFLVPFLENCSLEDEDSELTKRWAALLARAATEPNPAFIAYINILSNIDPDEAKILSELWKGTNPHEVFRAENFGNAVEGFEKLDMPFARSAGFTHVLPPFKDAFDPSRVVYAWHEDDVPNTSELSLVGDDRVVKLLHMQSLGLIRVSYDIYQERGKRIYCIIARLTPLGYHFVASCEEPSE
jgi:hypothetical protein